MKTKSNDTEKDSEDDKASKLDRFAADGVNCCNSCPVTRNETSNRENEIADTVVVQSTFNRAMIESTLDRYLHRQSNRSPSG
jgi:hypothetical protein